MSATVVRKLKNARKKLTLTQAELAKLLGVPLRTLISWENDQHTPHGLTWEAVTARLSALLKEKEGD
jgi:DNA-binding XRE family transcriptional regulator